MPTPRLVRWWFLVLLAAPAAAQHRPAVADPACTRVTVELVPQPGAPRTMGLRVRNTDPGDFPAHLYADLQVEQLVGSAWRRVSTAGLLLRSSCTQRPPETITVAPRATLAVVPWSGMVGDAQCDCTRCAPASAGTYRFVVRSSQGCVGPHQFESPAFALP